MNEYRSRGAYQAGAKKAWTSKRADEQTKFNQIASFSCFLAQLFIGAKPLPLSPLSTRLGLRMRKWATADLPAADNLCPFNQEPVLPISSPWHVGNPWPPRMRLFKAFRTRLNFNTYYSSLGVGFVLLSIIFILSVDFGPISY